MVEGCNKESQMLGTGSNVARRNMKYTMKNLFSAQRKTTSAKQGYLFSSLFFLEIF